MKVIFAGMPKTGTKSMCAALTYLGYNVYDYMENCEFLSKEWTKILEEGGTVEDFRKMYENVDAITDVPGCIFWEEISEAFPDAKVSRLISKNTIHLVDKELFKFRSYFPCEMKKIGSKA